MELNARVTRSWMIGEVPKGSKVRRPVFTVGAQVRNFINYYEAGDLVEYGKLKRVPDWLERAVARPPVARGLKIPAKP